MKNQVQRLDSQKYNIKNTKQNQSQFALKIGSFLQGNSSYKKKIKGVIKNLN